MLQAGGLCLQEPAILHLVFIRLSQLDLLLAQRVCRSWHKTIKSSKTLLALLFLHPDPALSQDVTASLPHTANPLLLREFPGFFRQDVIFNRFYDQAQSNLGPWRGTRMLGERTWREGLMGPAKGHPLPTAPDSAYMRPETSWRSMLPWMPPVSEVQLHIGDGSSGTLRCFTFTNQGNGRLRGFSKPWLTFGDLYDLIEAAWFRGEPERIASVMIDDSFTPATPVPEDDLLRRAPHLGLKFPWPQPTRANLQESLPSFQISGPGRLFISFLEETRSEAELVKKRREAVAARDKRQRSRIGSKTRQLFDDKLFTTEFRVEAQLTADMVCWTTVSTY